MTCVRCGAPIPAGMTTCPYCGTKATSKARTPSFDEETSFAETDAAEIRMEADEKTAFAGDGWPVDEQLPEEETEFAPKTAGRAYDAAPRPAPEKRPKKKEQSKKQKKPKEGRNTALRGVLVAVLVLLIIFLALR